MKHSLQLASHNNLQQLLTLVKDFHQFEGVKIGSAALQQSLHRLLSDTSLGRIWLICADSQSVGYIALTFGYSLEFGGKDAFIDELYIQPEFRGLGLGTQTLRQIQQEARMLNIQALHLEVARHNTKAKRLYTQVNFHPRENYMLMSAQITL